MSLPYYSSSSLLLTNVFLQSKNNNTDNENNIYLNNSVKIPYTDTSVTLQNINHSNAAIYLKDSVLSGQESSNIITWQKIQASDNDLTFNNSIILTAINANDILSNIYINDYSNVSNIIIHGNYSDNAYINFINSPNHNQGSSGIGFRYSNSAGRLQYSNNGTLWNDLTSANTTRLDDLEDVIITNALNNQYLNWNISSNKWINSNLSIYNDISPSLSNNLIMNNHNLISNNLFINNTSSNIVAEFNNASSQSCNYLVFNNSNIGNEPSINPNGLDIDIGITLNTKGDGNLVFNTNPGGNVFINSNILDIGGIMKNSIYRSSNKIGPYIPNTQWSIPISSDTILFDFTSNNTIGTYWANISAGIEGQKLNLIMFPNINGNTNIFGYSGNTGNIGFILYADFGNNGLCTGNGLASKIQFNRCGQSASLIYIGEPQNIWQILNTGGKTI